MNRTPASEPSTVYGLATVEEWISLSRDQRRIYLQALNGVGQAAMAIILARATTQAPDLILHSWRYFGYITPAEAAAAGALIAAAEA